MVTRAPLFPLLGARDFAIMQGRIFLKQQIELHVYLLACIMIITITRAPLFPLLSARDFAIMQGRIFRKRQIKLHVYHVLWLLQSRVHLSFNCLVPVIFASGGLHNYKWSASLWHVLWMLLSCIHHLFPLLGAVTLQWFAIMHVSAALKGN